MNLTMKLLLFPSLGPITKTTPAPDKMIKYMKKKKLGTNNETILPKRPRRTK